MIKNALWLFFGASIILFIFLPSYSRYQDLREKNADYASEIRSLKKENLRLSQEKRRLDNDPVYLEKVGREKMGLVREGEVVYKIVPEEAKTDK